MPSECPLNYLLFKEAGHTFEELDEFEAQMDQFGFTWYKLRSHLLDLYTGAGNSLAPTFDDYKYAFESLVQAELKLAQSILDGEVSE